MEYAESYQNYTDINSSIKQYGLSAHVYVELIYLIMEVFSFSFTLIQFDFGIYYPEQCQFHIYL